MNLKLLTHITESKGANLGAWISDHDTPWSCEFTDSQTALQYDL